jgi:hypothetical protein
MGNAILNLAWKKEIFVKENCLEDRFFRIRLIFFLIGLFWIYEAQVIITKTPAPGCERYGP